MPGNNSTYPNVTVGTTNSNEVANPPATLKVNGTLEGGYYGEMYLNPNGVLTGSGTVNTCLCVNGGTVTGTFTLNSTGSVQINTFTSNAWQAGTGFYGNHTINVLWANNAGGDGGGEMQVTGGSVLSGTDVINGFLLINVNSYDGAASGSAATGGANIYPGGAGTAGTITVNGCLQSSYFSNYYSSGNFYSETVYPNYYFDLGSANAGNYDKIVVNKTSVNNPSLFYNGSYTSNPGNGNITDLVGVINVNPLPGFASDPSGTSTYTLFQAAGTLPAYGAAYMSLNTATLPYAGSWLNYAGATNGVTDGLVVVGGNELNLVISRIPHTFTWTGATSTNFNDPSAWDQSTVFWPCGVDTAQVDISTSPTINVSGSQGVGTLTLTNGSSGGLTIGGAGSLTVYSTVSGTGAITVSGATLAVNGTLPSDTTVLTVTGGGTLTGTGTINRAVTLNSGTLGGSLTVAGAVTMTGSAAFTPSAGGTLALTSLTTNNNSGTYNFMLGTTSNKVTIGTINGNLNGYIYFTPGAGFGVGNTYTLIAPPTGAWGSATGGSMFVMTSPPSVLTYTPGVSASGITLSVSRSTTPGAFAWAGGSSGNWTTGNWTVAGVNYTGVYPGMVSGDSATIDLAGQSSPTITMDAARNIGSLTLSNSGTLTISGANALTVGSAVSVASGQTLQGSGTLNAALTLSARWPEH